MNKQWCAIRCDDCIGMAVKGDGHREPMTLPGIQQRLAKHRLMSEMQAVEDAQGGTDWLESGPQLIGPVDDLHAGGRVRCCGQNGKEKVWIGGVWRRSKVQAAVDPANLQASAAKNWFSFAVAGSVPHACSVMGIRRQARERTVQFLFQYDLNPPETLEGALDLFWESQHQAAISDQDRRTALRNHKVLPPPSAEDVAVRLFADPLIRGVVAHREELDDQIRKHVRNWELHRIAVVDRNVLRLAIFEMLHREDIPPVVSINEAVDIAKRFSTEDSGKFVNGILDKIKSELMRPARIVP